MCRPARGVYCEGVSDSVPADLPKSLESRAILRDGLIFAAVGAGIWLAHRLGRITLVLVLAMFFAYAIAPLVDLVQHPFSIGGRSRHLPKGLAIGVVYLMIAGSLAPLAIASSICAAALGHRSAPPPGLEVLTAENGLRALKVAQRIVPDIVVTDLNMPAMDGLALCRQLRAAHATRGVGVVIVTGDSEDQAQAALDAGCDAVLPKPCSRTLLLATVRLLLDRR